MRLYNKKIVVIIGQNDSTAIKIIDLLIKFNIDKQLSGKPSEGTVEIFNLNRDNENQIKQKGERIRLLAGYDGRLDLIYDGDIRRIDVERVGNDRAVRVRIGGNYIRLTSAIFNESYSGAVDVKTIVSDAIPSFGLEVSGLDVIPDSRMNDFSFTGRTSDLLDKLLKPLEIQWFEDDGFIKFSKIGVVESERVYLLKYDSGLISAGLVEPALEGSEKFNGIKFKAFLNGRIKLNNKIKIQSELVNGIFKVIAISYSGDNREGGFFIEGRGLAV